MPRVFGTWKSNLAQFQVLADENATYSAATQAWRGVFGGWDDNRTREVTEENVGLEVNSERPYDSQLMADISVPETEFTFEQALYMLSTGLLVPTPMDNDPAFGSTWTFNIPTDGSARTTNFLAWEIGNVKVAKDQVLIPLSFFSEIQFSGRRGESWKMSGTVSGNRYHKNGDGGFSGFTTGLSLPSVTPAMFSESTFFIDDSGGAIGSTQVEDVLLSADITIDTGVRWLPAGDGYLYPRKVKRGQPGLTFSFVLEVEEGAGVSIVGRERAFHDDPAHYRLMRLSTPGPNGENFTLDMAAKYDTVGPYAQEDDVDTAATFEGHASYSTTDDFFFSIAITADVDAL